MDIEGKKLYTVGRKGIYTVFEFYSVDMGMKQH